MGLFVNAYSPSLFGCNCLIFLVYLEFDIRFNPDAYVKEVQLSKSEVTTHYNICDLNIREN